MVDKIPMTHAGYVALEGELKHRQQVERPRIIKLISEARSHGDLSENAEYHAAKEQQGITEARMADLEDKLSRADIIDVSKLKGEQIMFGATVTLVDEDTPAFQATERFRESFGDDAAVILAVVLLNASIGCATESHSERTITALTRLELPPVQALRDGEVTRHAAEEVVPGDVLVLSRGTYVPADARLLVAERLTVDESALTGESRPVGRNSHEQVGSGAITAGTPVRLRAVRTAEDSTYAGIVRLVREAAQAKAPFTRMADRFALGFVPLTLLAGVALAQAQVDAGLLADARGAPHHDGVQRGARAIELAADVVGDDHRPRTVVEGARGEERAEEVRAAHHHHAPDAEPAQQAERGRDRDPGGAAGNGDHLDPQRLERGAAPRARGRGQRQHGRAPRRGGAAAGL